MPGLFERFFRSQSERLVRPNGHGGTRTGLGLAICKSIAKAHQGIIRYSPGPQGGALFEVLEAAKRPVMADADSRSFRDVLSVEIRSEPTVRHRILFDPGHGLEERLIVEQFA